MILNVILMQRKNQQEKLKIKCEDKDKIRLKRIDIHTISFEFL